MRRRREREEAFKMLYSMDLKDSWEEGDLEDHMDGYVGQVVSGVRSKKEEIDSIIGKYSKDWPLERMAVVDRNILRLAVYEMLHVPDVPPKVAINEAVELAKRYGDRDSYRFINGILDRILKEELGGGDEASR